MDFVLSEKAKAYSERHIGNFVPFYHRKDNVVMYRKIHYWLHHYVAKADRCTDKNCDGQCKQFNWSLKPGMSYDFNTKNFDFLCNRCNQKRDWTIEKAIKHALIRRKKAEIVGKKNSINTKNYYSNPENRKKQSERIKKYYQKKRESLLL